LRKYDVLGVGTALVDFFVESTDGFLNKNGLVKGATNFLPRETLDELHKTVADSIFTKLPGDNARNVCEGVSYLGGKSAYASSVAEDTEGNFFIKSLKHQGINSLVVKSPGGTGKIIVFITPDRQRTFAVDLGNSLDYDALPGEAIKESRFIYLTSITFLAKGKIGKTAKNAIKLAHETGTKVAFSLESPPMIEKNREKLLEIIDAIDVLFANEEEMAALIAGGDEAARWLSGKLDLLCLKKAERGSVLYARNEEFSIPCYSRKTVDTTGAGDFYAAGVIYGLSRGKPVEEAGHLGAKLAGRVVERFGATLHETLTP
jgi:hypothetical protein